MALPGACMDGARPTLGRIVVLARPTISRRLEPALRGGGYEVYRTPDATDVDDLVTRLRPHVVIVSLDSPWVNVPQVVCTLAARRPPVPVLLVGDARDGLGFCDTPRIPLSADEASLLGTVDRLRMIAGPGRD